jgi:hypothetical protein
MVRTDYLIHSRDIRIPRVTFVLEKSAAFRSQMIVAPARTTGAFDPPALNKAFLLQSAEHRIQRTDTESQSAAGSFFDQLSYFVAVPVLFLEKREYEEFWTTFFKFPVKHAACYIDKKYIVKKNSSEKRIRLIFSVVFAKESHTALRVTP